MYLEEICEAGVTEEIRRYHSPYNRPKGEKRSKRKNITSEEQFRVNERIAERKLRRLINANFTEGDYHLVLNYKPEERPTDREELRDDFTRFIRKLRRDAKKESIEIKYVHVYEIGERGAMHHHMVINRLDVKMIMAAWTKGRIRVYPLDDSGQYGKLAAYLIKYTSKMMRSENRLQGRRWMASRNLVKPKIKKRRIFRSTFRKQSQERKGFYIDKDFSCCYVDSAGYETIQTVYVKTQRRRE